MDQRVQVASRLRGVERERFEYSINLERDAPEALVPVYKSHRRDATSRNKIGVVKRPLNWARITVAGHAHTDGAYPYSNKISALRASRKRRMWQMKGSDRHHAKS